MTTHSSPSLLIVVVNFRTPQVTIDCLRALAAEVPSIPDLRVIVVENGSGDGSAIAIQSAIQEEGWSDWSHLLPLQENLGFAGGNNVGIRKVWQADHEEGRERSRYVLLLNSDTLVHQGCLRYCVDLMDKHADVGAMSCRLLNADGTLQVVARKFMSPLRLVVGVTGLPWKLPGWFGWAQTEYRGWDMETKAGDPDWIGGAFMLLKTDTMDQIGLLDEDFFFYGEDAEYCFRIRHAGWRIHYDPSMTTTHFGGSSSDPTRMIKQTRSKAIWRARYLFVRKCYGRAAMWSVRFTDAIGVVIKRFFLKVTLRGRSMKAEQLLMSQRTILGKLGPW